MPNLKQTSDKIKTVSISGLAQSKKWAVRFATGLAVFTPVFFAGSALGSKLGLWDWTFAFGTLVRGIGPKLLMLTLLVSIIALVLCFIERPRKGWAVLLIALLVPVLGLGYANSVKVKFGKLPVIHDISTNTQDVPTFSAAMIAAREEASNDLVYVGSKDPRSERLVSVEQVAAYPDIRTLVLEDADNIIFAKALAAVQSMGLTIVTNDKGAGIIEATKSSFWFGFKDDVIVRVRAAEGGGSIVDIRSVSRHGKSDIGVNAARVRKLSALILGK